jgi:hypothetical protein
MCTQACSVRRALRSPSMVEKEVEGVKEEEGEEGKA